MVKCEVRMTKVQIFWNGVCILSSSYAEINFVEKKGTLIFAACQCVLKPSRFLLHSLFPQRRSRCAPPAPGCPPPSSSLCSRLANPTLKTHLHMLGTLTSR
jgi:hypothetical protein